MKVSFYYMIINDMYSITDNGSDQVYSR